MQQRERTENIPVRKVVREERRQIEEEQQIPVESRTHNYTSYVYKAQDRVINPRNVQTSRTTNYNLIRDLNRQAADNTAVKNQIRDQASSRDYGYDSNIQDRSSGEGRIYHYGPTTRRDYQGRRITNRDQRGRIISSVDSSQKENQVQI